MLDHDPRSRAARRARPTPKAAETRARIVRGALRALEVHGLDGITTRRIAAEADVRLATIHYHFDDKEALLLAVLDAVVADLVAHLAESSRGCGTLEARIAAVLDASWAYAERTRPTQIVQYELTLYALRGRDRAWLGARQYRAYVDAYAAVLRPAHDEVELNSLDDVQARDLARLMLAGIDGLILQALAGGPCDAACREASRRDLDALTEAVRSRAAALKCGTPARKPDP